MDRIHWLAPLFVNGGGAAVEVGVDAGARWFTRVKGEVLPAEQDWRPLLPLMQPGYGGRWEQARALITARLAAAALPPELIRDPQTDPGQRSAAVRWLRVEG